MKKKVLVAAVLGVMTLGLLTGCGSQADVSAEVDEDNVVVQDSEETDTEETDTEEVTEDITETEVLKKITNYDADGTVTGYSEYEYDNAGIRIKRTDYNADGAVTSYSEYEYDETGAYTESTYSSDGTLTDESVYDEAGNLLKETTDDCCNEYEYDEAGNYLMLIFSSSTYYYETHYTYEEYNALGKGTKVSWITVDKNGETIGEGVEEHEFDEQGNHIRTLDEDGTVLYESEYDEHGNLISTSGGDYLGLYGYEYDSVGREIKSIDYDSDGNISSWREYEYGSLD